MPLQLPYVTVIPDGNGAAFFSYDSGAGYFFAYRNSDLIVDCWGKGGNGANGGVTLGGGGGGGGGHCQKNIAVIRGDVFKCTIDGSGNCNVSSSKYSLNMIASSGGNASGTGGGSGGTSSGGDVNRTGQAGFTASTINGGKGGNVHEGGAGGRGSTTAGGNGEPGHDPGGGGGGGYGGASSGLGAAGGSARIKFSWPLPIDEYEPI
jgi:hypothetical protein